MPAVGGRFARMVGFTLHVKSCSESVNWD